MDPQYLGIIITSILAVLGIIITILVVNKPRLKYYQIFPGKLFSEEVNDITKLTIRYDNKRIVGELIFLQVLINNEGNCDIDSRDIYEPLAITYVDPLSIIDAFIDKKTVNVDLEVNKNIIYLKWDLLKKNEYFIINVVLKNSGKNKPNINYRNLLKEYTTIKSRIKNIGLVKKESYLKIITNKDKLYNIILVSCLFLVLLYQAFDTLKINIETNRIQGEIHYLLESILENNKRIQELTKKIFYHDESVNEITETYESIDKNEIDIDENSVSTTSMPLIGFDKIIFNTDRIVLFYFISSLILLLFDIYLIINYLQKRKIAKYIK